MGTPPTHREDPPDENDALPPLAKEPLGGGAAPARHPCLALLRNALSNPDQVTAMISNYSTSYNAVNVSIVLPVIGYSLSMKAAGGDGAYSTPRYADSLPSYTSYAHEALMSLSTTRRLDDNEEDDEQESLVASSLLAGMVLGQLLGGLLGDILGRRNAMMLVMLLQIGGSLGSALLVSTSEGMWGLTTLEQLAVWRFILGIGAGGVYPLAAVMSAENGGEDGMGGDASAVDASHPRDAVDEQEWDDEGNIILEKEESRPAQTDDEIGSFQRIALTFSTQGLGFITVPLLAYPMLEWRWNVDAIWRILLGAGALPGFLVLYLRLCSGHAQCKGGEYEAAARAVEAHAADVEGILDTTNGPEADHEVSICDEDQMDPLEAPISTKTNEERGGPGDVSTLFSDVKSSDSNEAVEEQNDNELALVDNCHLMRKTAMQLDEEDGDATVESIHHSRGLWESIRAEPNLGPKLAGTAGTWFLFDVLFYGNTLFEPLVLEAAFGSHSADTADGYELLQTTVRDSLVISLLSLPGYFVTVLLIGRRTCVCRSIRSSSSRCGSALCLKPCHQSPAFIQAQGFFIMFLLYIIIGVAWSSLSNIQWLLLLLYAGTFFFANYGPNTTTFLLPSVTYSEDCRSTLNGISAAAGKMGALFGASVFAPAADTFGESVVMIACGCVSFVALLLTKACLGRKAMEHRL